MSDTVKLIIDIPKEEYELIVGDEACGLHPLARAVAHGIPLDDVKAIMEKQIERDLTYSETEVFKVPCHLGSATGLQVAVRILNNIGKAESEDKEW